MLQELNCLFLQLLYWATNNHWGTAIPHVCSLVYGFFRVDVWWAHPVRMGNTWCWDTVFSEEGQLIYREKGGRWRLVTIKEAISEHFSGLKCGGVRIKINWASLGRLFAWLLNEWLTTIRRYDPEWTKLEKSHVKYQQQEQYDCDTNQCSKLSEESRTSSTFLAVVSALFITLCRCVICRI